MRIGKRIMRVILMVIMFLLYFRGAIFLLDKLSERQVDKNSINRVSVVVLSKGNIKLVSYTSLPEYIKENPDYSFFIPKEQQACLLKQLKQSQPFDVSWSFTVTELSKDRQYIELDCFGDNRQVSYYEATDKSVFPKFTKSYGPPQAIVIFILSLITTSLTWSFGSFSLSVLQKLYLKK